MCMGRERLRPQRRRSELDKLSWTKAHLISSENHDDILSVDMVHFCTSSIPRCIPMLRNLTSEESSSKLSRLHEGCSQLGEWLRWLGVRGRDVLRKPRRSSTICC